MILVPAHVGGVGLHVRPLHPEAGGGGGAETEPGQEGGHPGGKLNNAIRS
jgi:hypothetical protein